MQCYYVTADTNVDEQSIQRKYSKCNNFQVSTDLLNSENLKVGIAQLCHKLQVHNFTMLKLTHK